MFYCNNKNLALSFTKSIELKNTIPEGILVKSNNLRQSGKVKYAKKHAINLFYKKLLSRCVKYTYKY